MAELEELLTSRVRVAVLRTLLLGGTHDFYERELARGESIPIGAMRRELRHLVRMGLVLTRRTKARRFYRADPRHGLYADLRQLFLKATLLEGTLRRINSVAENIHVAFVFGSCAKFEDDAESDVDLAVVGSTTTMELMQVIDTDDPRLGHHVNTMVFPEEELRRRYRAGERFVRELVDGPKLFIVGRDHDLRRVVEEEAPAARPRRTRGH